MDAEQLLMARLAVELRNTISARSLKECRVDSIVMSAGRKASEVIKKVEQITYDSGRQCFRAHFIKNDDPVILQGCFKIPTIKAELPKICVDWSYLSKEDFTERIVKGRSSGYISGIAGVGKSYTMLEITKEPVSYTHLTLPTKRIV